MSSRALCLPVAALVAAALLAGCRVDTHGGDANKNVDITTPFGSMHVKTDDSNIVGQTGMALYPGATVVHKHGDDQGSADVSMNFGNFRLGVHAAELQTPDPQQKVLAFYRKDMAQYGAVLTCRGQNAVGQPTRTADGLTCSVDHGGRDDGELQLRTGSPLHQHIVGLREEDGSTHIGLVALDLPASVRDHNGSEQE